jgi:REP-associated tyrosine transposase
MPTLYDPEKHHRRSTRLKWFDYRSAGAYFVTICTQHRKCLFGTIEDNEQRLNEAGRLVERQWSELPLRFPNVGIDAFVAMPNHIHGILLVGAQFIAPLDNPEGEFTPRHEGAINRAPTLGEILRFYKASSTRMIRQKVNPEFAWQRNYYEHIIRDEESHNRIRNYILENPMRWTVDSENPEATNPEPENAWQLRK